MTDNNKSNITVETTVNKTRKKLIVNWPTGKFTISDLEKNHPSAVPITLRFRVKKHLSLVSLNRPEKLKVNLYVLQCCLKQHNKVIEYKFQKKYNKINYIYIYINI